MTSTPCEDFFVGRTVPRSEGDRTETHPYADESFDAVVAAMVCCTIPNVETAHSEAARILKPGGEFRFLETPPQTGGEHVFRSS